MIIYTCPKCGNHLQNIVLTCNPPINKYECPNCGWSHEERQGEIIKMPFPIEKNNINMVNANKIDNFTNKACDGCPQHPKNGGSGICHCILGTPTITC